MLNSIREFAENGGKIFGECGGFMFLSKEIEMLDGTIYPMCNLVSCSVKMGNRLDISRFGYINILKDGKVVARGHEFHYSKIKEVLEEQRGYLAEKPNGKNWKCIFENKNVKAGYPHIHFFTGFELLKDILD